ncbi:acyltransferase family protein [Butyrivibrio sp. YAB3001]|uniref:acyltransferase family protein n=1 Tax=Butyrivibrio sp. YAB3001 TaxID=1520812 RepID=UPI0008F685B9|nr:acyltransferase family protein [Butyrivibrio sp. YAB3001]SFC26474.1 Acyltransferase family protein [Butyrivibrio sp. YAB3001]
MFSGKNIMEERTTLNRQIYLDIAKGIGIIMVVWAHAYGPITSFIGSFHMPFFFFISGMLYKGYKPVNTYIKGKLKSLLIPFWLYNLMFYPVFLFFFIGKNGITRFV